MLNGGIGLGTPKNQVKINLKRKNYHYSYQ